LCQENTICSFPRNMFKNISHMANHMTELSVKIILSNQSKSTDIIPSKQFKVQTSQKKSLF